ncbi:hypothetical protein HYFRA_00003108 [Hymenoscyphus fraxineus]|uniref:Uncharacterized protein n=1 Tax=Hymenoscyphus fraxineus TaxID=746836 RepID=A0A9N9KPD9_9HELO|nr:hypothetical protein HYFRA_00003108 [Hymenoscyphus fraxineus]
MWRDTEVMNRKSDLPMETTLESPKNGLLLSSCDAAYFTEIRKSSQEALAFMAACHLPYADYQSAATPIGGFNDISGPGDNMKTMGIGGNAKEVKLVYDAKESTTSKAAEAIPLHKSAARTKFDLSVVLMGSHPISQQAYDQGR